jgi:hypothetical protein
VTVQDVLKFGDTVSYFFDQCHNTNLNTGTAKTQNTNNYDARELMHQIELLKLEIKLCQAEKQKAELEAQYWKNQKNEA